MAEMNYIMRFSQTVVIAPAFLRHRLQKRNSDQIELCRLDCASRQNSLI